MKDGTRVPCVCGKEKEECTISSHQKASKQVPYGWYAEAPVGTEKYAPAGLLRPGCASKKSEVIDADSSEKEPSDDDPVDATPSNEDASSYEDGFPQGVIKTYYSDYN